MTAARRIPEHLKRENEIQRDVVNFFRRLGCKVFVTSEPRPRRGSSPDVLDLYLLLPFNRGDAWYDTKQPGNGLSEGQEKFAAECEKRGVPCGFGPVAGAHAFARRLKLVIG